MYTAEVRKIISANNRASSEAIVDVVGCDHCGALKGEYCIGRYGKRTISMHCARRLAASVWRKTHPKEWTDIKEEIFNHLLEKDLSQK